MTAVVCGRTMDLFIFILCVVFVSAVGIEDVQFATQCGSTLQYEGKFKLLLSASSTYGRNCDVTLTARHGRNIKVYFIPVDRSLKSCAEISLFDFTQSEKTYQGEMGRYIVKWNKQSTFPVCISDLPGSAYISISNTLKIRLRTPSDISSYGFAIQVEEDSGSILPMMYFCHETLRFSGSMYVASFPWRKVEGAPKCVTRFVARNKKHISVSFKELYIDGTTAGQCSFNGLLISDGKSLEGPYMGGGYLCGDHIPDTVSSTKNNITLQLNLDKKTSLYPRRYFLAMLHEHNGDEDGQALVPLNSVVGAAIAVFVVCAVIILGVVWCQRRKIHNGAQSEKGSETETVSTEDHSDKDIEKDSHHTGSGSITPVRYTPEKPKQRHLSETPLLEPTAPSEDDVFEGSDVRNPARRALPPIGDLEQLPSLLTPPHPPTYEESVNDRIL